jgi:hypothetical protein
MENFIRTEQDLNNFDRFVQAGVEDAKNIQNVQKEVFDEKLINFHEAVEEGVDFNPYAVELVEFIIRSIPTEHG